MSILSLSRPALVSAAELSAIPAESLAAGLQTLDSSWFMPNSPRNAKQEFQHKRLFPSSRYADIDGIKDEASPFPHMLPTVETFNREIGKLGVTDDKAVVVYDTVGNMSAPRFAWTLEIFGHPSVGLLNTFPDWIARGNPIDETEKSIDAAGVPNPFVSRGLDKSRVILFEELKDIVSDPAKAEESYVIFDARSAGRFTGSDPEPRAGLSSGHVPTAINLPFGHVLDTANNNVFLDPESLKAVFSKALGGKPLGDRQVITMCGTGVTACILERALRIAELTDKPIRVYDGSWTEWAQRATGALIVKDV